MFKPFSTKTSAAGLSILSNSLLVVFKLVAGLLMGSVSVLAEAIHSAVDLLAAVIAFFSIRAAAKPPDSTHNFGHGKIENISGTFEGLLIFGAAAYIIYEAVNKVISGVEVELLSLGIVIMGVSALANLIVSRHLHRVAKRTDSVALEADAWHLTTDVYTSAGVMVGLVAVWLTGWHILDPLIAIGVAGLIVKAAWGITRKSFRPLLDVRLPKHELKAINACVAAHTGKTVGFHALRTRKSGYQRFIDLHLVFPKSVTIEEAHNVCDIIEQDIGKRLPNSQVTIHCEPCETNADGSCPAECPATKTCPTPPQT
ncbi:MAG: cation diffusion facilitator family transporter [Chloroflexota bacterium]